ncbi:hypothetical protein M3Y94_00562200 [Aphelenchoides besseyi]|nr:hypothetical protein M3Y94_00562200 [Aphelenchoides besseyi]KAI6225542.1 hypothetical protein M3Y95_00708200 [Aphelenchoides besseyi]
MFQNNKIKHRKLREDLDRAHDDFYEDWMEPNFKPSTNGSQDSKAKEPKLKNRSKFKFADVYERDVISTGSDRKRGKQLSSSSLPRSQSANALLTTSKNEKSWTFKEVNFERFYAWVKNGKLDDLYLVKHLLFED